MTSISPAVSKAAASVLNIGAAFAALTSIPKVYPGYIGMRIKKALLLADSEQIIREIGDMETIGDCKYAIPVTDFNGSKYRVTVEVVK